MASDRIETLIRDGKWKSAQNAIEKELKKESDDHWLWSRLSGVKYEQHDYQGALEAAEEALRIVEDCPLALWSRAGALDMLGRTAEAGKVYAQLVRRGIQEIKDPDEDAEECWEGPAWTKGLVMDSIFRVARCLAKLDNKRKAVELYQQFLILLDYGMRRGIHSREDAVKRLKELVPSEEAMESARELTEAVALA